MDQNSVDQLFACTAADQHPAARGKQEMSNINASILGFCWPCGVNYHKRTDADGKAYRDCNGKGGYCTMDHDGPEKLSPAKVDAMQAGMDKLIANNREGGKKRW